MQSAGPAVHNVGLHVAEPDSIISGVSRLRTAKRNAVVVIP